METLNVIEAKGVQTMNLLVQFAGTKVNADNVITDEATRHAVAVLMQQFWEMLNATEVWSS